MGLSQLRIFQYSIFKQIAFLFTSQKITGKSFLASESGVLSLKDLPLSTGYIEETNQRMSWTNIQNLKVTMPKSETPVLPINERSLYPLDPYGKLSDEEKRSQASLKTIAETKYVEAQANVSEGKNETQAAKMAKTVLWTMAVVALMVLLILMIRGCGS